jgi:hypothetical protein
MVTARRAEDSSIGGAILQRAHRSNTVPADAPNSALQILLCDTNFNYRIKKLLVKIKNKDKRRAMET